MGSTPNDARCERAAFINERIKTTREINAANGWNLTQEEDWEDDYKVPAVIALIHTEITEAFEAESFNNFVEEQADIFIRVMDLVGAFGDEYDFGRIMTEFDLTDEDVVARDSHLSTLLREHKYASRAVEAFRANDKFVFVLSLAKLALTAEQYAGRFGHFWTALNAKLEKNKGRGHKHGGKRI